MKTVVALYDQLSDANASVHDLLDFGLGRDQISLMAADISGEFHAYLSDTDESAAATGAGIGAIVGGLGGLLVGLGIVVIPGIGPVLAAGPLATAISALTGVGVGVMAGGAAGGLLGVLIDLVLPEEVAGHYAEGVRRGGTLVTVHVDDHQAEDVRRIMNRHNVINIDKRVRGWRDEGWIGFQEDVVEAQPVLAVGRELGAHSSAAASGRELISQHPQGIATGGEPHVEPQRTDEPQGIATGGEPHVEPQRTDEPQGIATGGEPVTMPKRIDQPQGMAGGGWGRQANRNASAVAGSASTSKEISERLPFDSDERFGRYNIYFEEHFNTHYANHGLDYRYYRPAYYFGYLLADDDRFRDKTWDDIEPDARREWGLRSDMQGAWEDFKDAVHDAWLRVRKVDSDARN